MSEFVEEVIDAMNDLKDRHPVVYSILIIPYFLFIGFPLIIVIALRMLHSFIFRLKDKRCEKKVVFCFLPKFSSDGIIWFRKANREVYANSDMISFCQYRYSKIKRKEI